MHKSNHLASNTIEDTFYDLLIIGGGINGVGIARDAAGRGLKVLLCEQNDLASATSSYSSKLIHGGLRYLEHYEFRLVRAALQEREVLLNIAPHLVKPLEFIMPHGKTMRPSWLIRCGLFIYDHLAKRKQIPGSRKIHHLAKQLPKQLKAEFKQGFSYYDCMVDDARLVINTALDAQHHGACILPYHRCDRLTATKNQWHAQLRNQNSQAVFNIKAKCIVNAAGPWVDTLLNDNQLADKQKLALVKGSHIIVPRLFSGEHAYILQNDDDRIVFIIPHEQDFHLIGTTDVAFSGDPATASISNAEIDYLCNAVNHYLKTPINKQHIHSTYAGVRALTAEDKINPSKISRDFQLELIYAQQAPLLNILGGKLTTHRELAEQATNKLQKVFANLAPAWTAHKPLIGSFRKHQNSEVFHEELQKKYPWLPDSICKRLINLYGIMSENVLDDAKSITDLGFHFGHGLYEKEVLYLINHEWARNVEDILWRRSKLGLFFSEESKQKLIDFLEKTN